MKKTILILFISLFNPFFAEAAEKEAFVNPVFNEIMEPISTIAWENRVTPASITTVNVEGYKRYQKCKLVENTMEKISFHCNEDEEVMTDKEFTEVVTYTIEKYDKFHQGLVVEKKYKPFGELMFSTEYLRIAEEHPDSLKSYGAAEK